LFTTTVTNDTATDGPSASLVDGTGAPYAEAAQSFSAVMYLMWTPGAQGSIPVPLASLSWLFASDAINTLTNQPNHTNPAVTTTFALGCGPGTANGCSVIVPSSDATNMGYPTWGNTFKNGALSCSAF